MSDDNWIPLYTSVNFHNAICVLLHILTVIIIINHCNWVGIVGAAVNTYGLTLAWEMASGQIIKPKVIEDRSHQHIYM